MADDLLIHAKLIRQTARPAAEIRADFASIKKAADETGKATTAQARQMDKLAREYNRATAAQEKLAREMLRSQQASAQKWKQTGADFTRYLTVPIVIGGAAAVKSFSNLNEAADAASRTFGKAYTQIQLLATGANKQLGLSKRAVNEFSASFGGMLSATGIDQNRMATMTEQLIRRGVDLGSYWNVSNQDINTALLSGLAGEAEPLRRRGVLLSEARVKEEAYRSGIAKSGAELTEQQKILARYNVIMADSARFAGNFAATQDSIANRGKTSLATLEDLGAVYGEKLVPMVAEFLDLAIPVMQWMIDVPGPVKAATLALLGLAAVAGPLMQLAGAMAAVRTASALSALAGGGGAAAAGEFAGMAAAGGALGAGAVTAGIVAPVVAGYTYLGWRDNKRQKARVESAAQRSLHGLALNEYGMPTNAAMARARLQQALSEQRMQAQEAARLDALAEAQMSGGFQATTYRGEPLMAGTFSVRLQNDRIEAKKRADALQPVIDQLTVLTAGTVEAEDAMRTLGEETVDAASKGRTKWQETARQLENTKRIIEQMGQAWETSMGKVLGRDMNELEFERTVLSAIETMKGKDGLAKQSAIIDVFSGAQQAGQFQLDQGLIRPDELVSTTQKYLYSALGRLGKLDPTLQAQVDTYIANTYVWAADVSKLAMRDTMNALMSSWRQQLPSWVSVGTGWNAGTAGDSPVSTYRGPITGNATALRTTFGLYGGLSAGLGTRVSNALVGQHPGSDHFRGRALDMVGAGLPAMQARLIAAGGRAEFHGLGAARHLHGVFPAGDSRYGYSTGMDGQRAGGSTVIERIEVNAASGQQAGEVVDELERRVRRAQELGRSWP